MVDLVGLEPTTSSMPWKRAPSCATGPRIRRNRKRTIYSRLRKYVSQTSLDSSTSALGPIAPASFSGKPLMRWRASHCAEGGHASQESRPGRHADCLATLVGGGPDCRDRSVDAARANQQRSDATGTAEKLGGADAENAPIATPSDNSSPVAFLLTKIDLCC